jgi:hypothetical protein
MHHQKLVFVFSIFMSFTSHALDFNQIDPQATQDHQLDTKILTQNKKKKKRPYQSVVQLKDLASNIATTAIYLGSNKATNTAYLMYLDHDSQPLITSDQITLFNAFDQLILEPSNIDILEQHSVKTASKGYRLHILEIQTQQPLHQYQRSKIRPAVLLTSPPPSNGKATLISYGKTNINHRLIDEHARQWVKTKFAKKPLANNQRTQIKTCLNPKRSGWKATNASDLGAVWFDENASMPLITAISIPSAQPNTDRCHLEYGLRLASHETWIRTLVPGVRFIDREDLQSHHIHLKYQTHLTESKIDIHTPNKMWSPAKKQAMIIKNLLFEATKTYKRNFNLTLDESNSLQIIHLPNRLKSDRFIPEVQLNLTVAFNHTPVSIHYLHNSKKKSLLALPGSSYTLTYNAKRQWQNLYPLGSQ